MWELPKEYDGVKYPRFDIQSTGSAGPTDQRWHGTGKSTDENAQRRFPFQWGIEEQIGQQCQSPQRTRKQVDRGSKIDGSCRCQSSSEGQDGNRFETAGCGGGAGGVGAFGRGTFFS